MFTRYEGGIPGTLMATRLAPGNRGGLRLRVYGSDSGLEWDIEDAEPLRISRLGEPDGILTRGHSHGIPPTTERLVRTACGFPEGLIDACANLYLEFAMSLAARADGVVMPAGWTAI